MSETLTYSYTVPPTPKEYPKGAYAQMSYYNKTAPRTYSPLLCFYLPFLIIISVMFFLLFHNQNQLPALLEEYYLDEDALGIIIHANTKVVYILSASFFLVSMISCIFNRRILKYIYCRNYLLHESLFTADNAGCRQIYPQQHESWFGWATLDSIQTVKGDILLIFGCAFIVLPHSIFADEAEKQGFIEHVTAWQQAALKHPAP
ncbi:hypothetical protein H9Q10_01810 [Eikenella sp. S3360]|uniref:YcxB-like protein domain-containing protein n=1 Tax=Eikenella glucosivorans TaxID=2766967 RepID=A0ABS0N7X2_9NEIS|nr:hypothetical protein [Eikenella glucosivorans]MBH5328407.1 hypothetical protein [Eikenella glucosivorans]